MCQYLAVESTHPSTPLFEDCSSSEATTPITVQHIRPTKVKKRKQSPIPPLPIVVQLMEMGFPRKNIEFALKSLSGTSGSASGLPGILFSKTNAIGRRRKVASWLKQYLSGSSCCPLFGYNLKNAEESLGDKLSLFSVLGVEALVGWLLDHPDVQITDLSDADTISDEYSDEEIAEEVEEAEAACPVVSINVVNLSCAS